MNTKTIPSEAFKKSYSIFIDRRAADAFDQFLGEKHYKSQGVRIVNAVFNAELSAIIIPENVQHDEIERHLFEWKRKNKNASVKKSQFWGQKGMSYIGKTWVPY
jgi:hypothetical protein